MLLSLKMKICRLPPAGPSTRSKSIKTELKFHQLPIWWNRLMSQITWISHLKRRQEKSQWSPCTLRTYSSKTKTSVTWVSSSKSKLTLKSTKFLLKSRSKWSNPLATLISGPAWPSYNSNSRRILRCVEGAWLLWFLRTILLIKKRSHSLFVSLSFQ